jgi:hypothetical protein
MEKVMTHTGRMVGCDARTPVGYNVSQKLRETKLHWITESNRKFRKTDGLSLSKWPLYKLLLGTIVPLATENAQAISLGLQREAVRKMIEGE